MVTPKAQLLVLALTIALAATSPATAQDAAQEVGAILDSIRSSLRVAPIPEEPGLAVRMGGNTRTITVNCGGNRTINKALRNKAAQLIIEVNGICHEDVLIRRDHVTLRGTDPAVDGVQGVTLSSDDPFSSAVTIREARHIHIENLGLTGGADGLRVENARRNITADNLVLTGTRFGVVTVGGTLTIENSTLTGSGTAGLAAAESGLLVCNTCTIADNPSVASGFGAFAISGSGLTVRNSTISGSRFPIIVDQGAEGLLTNVVATNDGSFGPFVSNYSKLTLLETSFDGALFVDEKAIVNLAGATQTSNLTGLNLMTADSLLTVSDRFLDGGGVINSALLGATVIDVFSQARFLGGTVLDTLTCGPLSNATCDGTVTKTSSTCGACP